MGGSGGASDGTPRGTSHAARLEGQRCTEGVSESAIRGPRHARPVQAQKGSLDRTCRHDATTTSSAPLWTGPRAAGCCMCMLSPWNKPEVKFCG